MQSKEKDPRIQALPISELKFKKNVRSEAEKSDIESLARSIKEVGVLQPIHVRAMEGGFEILFGHRRTLAAIACGLATIPAIVVDAIDTDSAVLQRQLVENIQRESLNPIDQALAIEELMELDQLTNGEVAERIGTIPAAISKSLAILSLQSAIQAWVRDGLIPASCAYELSKVKEEALQLALAQKVKDGKLTRAQLQAAIKPAPIPLSSEKPRSLSRSRPNLETVKPLPSLPHRSTFLVLSIAWRKCSRVPERNAVAAWNL